MDKQQLRANLQQLHAELSRTQTLDPEAETLLRDLQADIQTLLQHAEPEAQHYQPLDARLKTAVEQFEVSHPVLAESMQAVLEILSRMGI